MVGHVVKVEEAAKVAEVGMLVEAVKLVGPVAKIVLVDASPEAALDEVPKGLLVLCFVVPHLEGEQAAEHLLAYNLGYSNP